MERDEVAGYSNKAFSQRLEARLVEAKLSLEGLATESGIASGLIARYEAGQATPDLETAYTLALTLGCGIDDLAGLPLPRERERADCV